MVSAYQGSVRDGLIYLDDDSQLPDGTRVIIVVVEEQEAIVGLTARELAESELVGMWADRDDIEDSSAFARQLREQAQRRHNASSSHRYYGRCSAPVSACHFLAYFAWR